MCEQKPSMLLITAEWNERNSFKMIPMTKECPFSEGIFDINTKVLAMMSYQSKDSVHLLPRLDDDGELVTAKKQRQNGKRYKEQRVTLDTFVEYYVSIPEEIIDIIKRLAINADTFDYTQYLNADAKLVSEVPGSEVEPTKKPRSGKPDSK
ncbi:MAG: hypothetical protein WCK31_04535 [bacterium]